MLTFRFLGPLTLGSTIVVAMGCTPNSAPPSEAGRPPAKPAVEAPSNPAPSRREVILPDWATAQRRVVAAAAHTCVRSPGGESVCWGDNAAGMVIGVPRTGVEPQRASPVMKALATSPKRTCGIDPQGRLSCWGAALPQESVDAIAAQDAFRTLAVDDERVCAITVDHRLFCGARAELAIDIASPVRVALGGSRDACAIDAEGVTWCWSWDSGGHPSPVRRMEDLPASSILGLGPSGTGCALGLDHKVRCWNIEKKRKPTVVQGADQDVIDLSVGREQTCAVRRNGQVVCWRSALSEVLPIARLPPSEEVAVGDDHVCARTRVGAVYCWGSGRAGQLGGGAHEDEVWTAITVQDVAGATALATSETERCAVEGSGLVRCWGFDAPDGRFAHVGGVGHAERVAVATSGGCALVGPRARCWDGMHPASDGPRVRRGRAELVEHDRPIVGLASNAEQMCAIEEGGTVSCWGTSIPEEGREVHIFEPMRVSNLEGVRAIAMLTYRAVACGHLEDSSVSCWSLPDIAAYPMARPAPDLGRPKMLSAAHSLCALTPEDEVQCFTVDLAPSSLDDADDGEGGGEYDPGPELRFRRERKSVSLPEPATAIAVADEMTCALLQTEEVVCWTAGRRGFKRVSGLEHVVQLVAQGSHACARTREGEVKCWGEGEYDPAGRRIDWTSVPVHVYGPPDATPSVTVDLTVSLEAMTFDNLWSLIEETNIGGLSQHERHHALMTPETFEDLLTRAWTSVFVEHGLEEFDFYPKESYPRLSYWENLVDELPDEFKGVAGHGYASRTPAHGRLMALLHRIDRSPDQLRDLFEQHKSSFYRIITPTAYHRLGFARYTKDLLRAYDHLASHPDYPRVLERVAIELERQDRLTDQEIWKRTFSRTEYSIDTFAREGLLVPALYQRGRERGALFAGTDTVWFSSFWVRRHLEGNTPVVRSILQEIDAHYGAAPPEEP